MAHTCKTIVLKGNQKKPESGTHIIEFPGGNVEISRTLDNEYWVHISLNDQDGLDGWVNLSKEGVNFLQ